MDTSIDERVAAMTPATGVVIHTEELTKVYPGDIRAVIDLNLDVNEGEIFGLLGPNGAGQDDHGRDAHDPGHPDRGPGLARAASTSSRTRRRPSA